jgi:DUF971 family protein
MRRRFVIDTVYWAEGDTGLAPGAGIVDDSHEARPLLLRCLLVVMGDVLVQDLLASPIVSAEYQGALPTVNAINQNLVLGVVWCYVEIPYSTSDYLLGMRQRTHGENLGIARRTLRPRRHFLKRFGGGKRMRFSADPVDYHLDEARHLLVIRWRDGHESRYPFDDLRQVCPCADCRTAEKPQGGLKVLTGPVVRRGEIRIVEISPVGRYALSFTWSDGHRTGIYSFDFLRRLCPCEACRSGGG